MTDPPAHFDAVESPVADPELREALVRDDLAEECGMPAGDRRTCHGCRAWATIEHFDSPRHRALLERHLQAAFAAAQAARGELVR